MKRKHLYGKLDPKKIARSLEKEVPTWEQIWKRCWARVRSRRPANWSLANWRELMLAEAWEATWLALVAFDGRKGLTLDEYVRLGIQNAFTAAARQERRYTSHLNKQTARELAARAAHGDEPVRDERLEWLLSQLSEDERLLVAEFFFTGKTEAEIGAGVGRSQQWVNKHKTRLLNKMRKIGKNWGGKQKSVVNRWGRRIITL